MRKQANWQCKSGISRGITLSIKSLLLKVRSAGYKMVFDGAPADGSPGTRWCSMERQQTGDPVQDGVRWSASRWESRYRVVLDGAPADGRPGTEWCSMERQQTGDPVQGGAWCNASRPETQNRVLLDGALVEGRPGTGRCSLESRRHKIVLIHWIGVQTTSKRMIFCAEWQGVRGAKIMDREARKATHDPKNKYQTHTKPVHPNLSLQQERKNKAVIWILK
jgi:hypothetical protein